MPSNVQIEDLGRKITLLLRSKVGSAHTQDQLLAEMEIGKDMFSRIKSGTRVLSEETFLKLCKISTLEQRDWYKPLALFGEQLGFSRHSIATMTGMPVPGIDFASRINDPDLVNATFKVIAGYWEALYYSVSKIHELLVSCDLLIVKKVDEDNFIECEIDDSLFRYTGWCFPIRSHLYFVLEKANLLNEIIVYATNQPDRQPPRLFGIMLSLSGGVDEIQTYPCAAKVAFRYLGQEAELRKRFGLADSEDLALRLRKEIPDYVSPTDPTLDEDTRQMIRDISNAISEGDVPCALRMTK